LVLIHIKSSEWVALSSWQVDEKRSKTSFQYDGNHLDHQLPCNIKVRGKQFFIVTDRLFGGGGQGIYGIGDISQKG